MSAGPLIAVDRLRAAIALVVAGFGSSAGEAAEVGANLIEANLMGHDSHGIGMLPRYAESYLEGGLKPNTGVHTVLDAGALIRLDGGAGFGQVVGRQAMEIGIARARELGACTVALGNAHHLGRIGAWAELAAAAGLVSLHFVNVISRPIVAPYGGADARFGTNPFTAGVPLPGRPPMILDFATSVVAQGKTRVAHNQGEAMAAGLLIDDRGRPTTDPRYGVVPPFGALLAFGEHKGYGLAVLCELLGGALAAGMTQRTPYGGEKRILNGMLTVLVDPAALGDKAAFEREAEAFLGWLLAAPARAGFEQVRLAGDPERATRAERSAAGVPVDATTWEQILGAAASLGVDPQAVARAAGTPGG